MYQEQRVDCCLTQKKPYFQKLTLMHKNLLFCQQQLELLSNRTFLRLENSANYWIFKDADNELWWYVECTYL